MKVNVFGLGYVGNVVALSLAKRGHTVVGVEVVKEKVDALKGGQALFFEPGLDNLLALASQNKLKGSFEVLQKLPQELFNRSEVSLVCVGTPSLNSGLVDLSQMKATLQEIGRMLARKKKWHDVIIRSTVPPGTTEHELIPLLEKESKKKAGKHYGVAFYPEFFREGSSLKDFDDPGLNIAGCLHPKTFRGLSRLFKVKKKLAPTQIKTAEMIKYANNSFHGLKVAFANEMGTLARAYGVDEEWVRVFLNDTASNVSSRYLRPGFAFGGSCLPKELRALSGLFLQKGLTGPLTAAILPSNEAHIDRLVAMVQSLHFSRLGFMGVTFKADTDDIRESPLLKTLSKLLKSPSYKKEPKIAICDRPMVIEKVKKLFAAEPLHYSGDPLTLMEKTDCLILGPFRLSAQEMKTLGRYRGEIIDLKWFPVPDSIKRLPHYRRFC